MTMRATFLFVTLLLAAAMASAQVGPLIPPPMVPAAKPAPPVLPPPEKRLISNVFENTDIRTVLSEIGTAAGVVIVPDQTVEGVVTVQLENVPFERALQMVLASGGFVYKKMDGFYLVGLPKPDSATFTTFSDTQTLKFNYVQADAAAKTLPPALAAYVRCLPATNSATITAPPLLLDRIVADLKAADKPQLHVMLDARIVAIERNDLLNLGVQWAWPTLQAGAFGSSDTHGGGSSSNVNWPWAVQVGYTTGKAFTTSLLLTLNLLAQNDEATILSNPRLMAQDGKEAQISVNTEQYFQIVTQGIYVQAQLEKIASGTILKITPSIAENGDITLDMTTEVSDVIATGANGLPVVTRRTTHNTVRIQDGGTAAVAGLTDTHARINDQRVPGVSKLPIVGAAFKNESDAKSTREVAVFITAKLMPLVPPKTDAVASAPRPAARIAGPEFKNELRESLRRLNEVKPQ